MNPSISISGVEIEQIGRVTIATLSYPEADTLDRLGARPVRPEFMRGIQGVGIARCRTEDHFDPDIGAYLAVQRAHRNLADQIEARVIGLVRTEREHELDQLGERFSDAINEFVEMYNTAMASVGHDGRIL